MSYFKDFVNALAPTIDAGSSGATRGAREHDRRRRRMLQGKGAVEKQDVERRAQLNDEISESAIRQGASRKPYDPLLLRDLARNAVVQAYIDTLSQDVAGANWAVVPRDEQRRVNDGILSAVERELKHLHPQRPFRDLLESTTRNLLQLGDATWVKHYRTDRKDELAEAVVADSATFFKKIDDHGLTDGYVQTSITSGRNPTPFAEREVVWYEWGNSPDRFYGEGPVEKAQEEIELVEELAEKERLDLIQGSPPGVISQSPNDDFGGMSDEQWENFKERMKLDEGERHRVGYSKVPIEFQPLSSNYQELQVLERSKYWVTVLGAVFKCNPSYVGFDFENVNRATDESQQEAYAQRGFRVTLRALEESLNRQLVWPEYSEDVRFEFEREQTASEQKTRAELLERQATAGKELSNAGLDVTYRDGQLTVEDGPVDEGNVGSSGGGGGFFGSVDDPDDAEIAISRKGNGHDPDPDLTHDELVTLEEVILRAHKRQIEPESLEAIEKVSWGQDEDVPDYVFEKIEEVIDDALFDDIESIPGDVADFLEDFFKDKLTQPQGWSLDSMVDDLSDHFPDVDTDMLETVARTETTSVLNEAREQGYKDREDAGEEFRFYWQGPDDSRTTDLCDALKAETNPDYGGDPVPLDDLVTLEREFSNEYFPDLTFRKHAPHINCRHTFVRAVGATIDVDVPTAEDIAAAEA